MSEDKKPQVPAAQSARMYQLKITLRHIKPPIWRRLLVRGDTNLGLLHAIIQVSMGWTNSHLHQFIVGSRTYSDPVFELGADFGGPRVLDEKKTTLMQIAPREKARFAYEYDFGDGWEHLITVEKIVEQGASSAPDLIRGECTGGARACPPDDCGGPFGYPDFLEILRNSRHEEHESMMEWVGGEFDPEAFDSDRINKYLRKLKWPQTTISQLARVLAQMWG